MLFRSITPTPFDNMTPEEIINIVQDLPPGMNTTKIVELALSKLGIPYSNSKRMSNGYYDCSSFTYRIYKEVGVNLEFEGMNTAAAQAEWWIIGHRLKS